jgi:hypothetical protein
MPTSLSGDRTPGVRAGSGADWFAPFAVPTPATIDTVFLTRPVCPAREGEVSHVPARLRTVTELDRMAVPGIVGSPGLPEG